jgi:subtilisin family serine protease
LPNNSYGKQQGTSMAAPHVAGVCAVLLDPNTQYPSSRNLDFPGLVRRPTPSTLNAAYLRSMATEFIPGIKGDKLKYPMINFKVK